MGILDCPQAVVVARPELPVDASSPPTRTPQPTAAGLRRLGRPLKGYGRARLPQDGALLSTLWRLWRRVARLRVHCSTKSRVRDRIRRRSIFPATIHDGSATRCDSKAPEPAPRPPLAPICPSPADVRYEPMMHRLLELCAQSRARKRHQWAGRPRVVVPAANDRPRACFTALR